VWWFEEVWGNVVRRNRGTLIRWCGCRGLCWAEAVFGVVEGVATSPLYDFMLTVIEAICDAHRSLLSLPNPSITNDHSTHHLLIPNHTLHPTPR
jgi:hypothetical protein